MPTPTAFTKFIGIEEDLVDLARKKSQLLNVKTDAYTLSDITGAMRISAAAVLTQAGWTLVGSYYQQQVNNTNILATSFVIVTPDNDDVPIVQAAEVLPQNDSVAGGVIVYSENQPSADIGITLNIFL
jgi:hypothetical protein